MDFLITGGAGFIGCAVASELMNDSRTGRAPTIVAADNLHPQIHIKAERPASLPDSVDLRVMDICDAAAWDDLLRSVRPRNIIHLAAETGTGQSLDLPTRHTHTNVTGTAAMIEALGRVNQIPEHIFLSSSRAVYGEGAWSDPSDGQIFQPGHRTRAQLNARKFAILAPSGREAVPLNHHYAQVQPRPTSIYGATKLSQEHLLLAWTSARDAPLTIMRFQNVYGVGQSPHNPYTGIIGLFHRRAAANLPIEVYEDGEIGRDFVYIDDIARAVAASLYMPPAAMRIADVGSGVATTILEAARSIAALYQAPNPEVTGAFRYGDVRWAVCDASSLSDQLPVSASISFEEGNRLLSAWLRETGVI